MTSLELIIMMNNNIITLVSKIEKFDELYDRGEEIILNSNVEKHYFSLNDNEVTIQNVSYSFGQILNEFGMVQVGDYVGTFRKDELIWTEEENAEVLKNAIVKEKFDNENFIRIKHRNNNRNWTVFESCPKDNTWFGPINQYKNPNAVRRIDVQNIYERIVTPVSNGNFNVTYSYTVKGTSRKQAWNKYQTDHYQSIDITCASVSNGVEISSSPFVEIEQHNNTKVANTQIFINLGLNVPSGWWDNNFLRLKSTTAGSTGWNGTAASHQGMGGRYGRQDCS